MEKNGSKNLDFFPIIKFLIWKHCTFFFTTVMNAEYSWTFISFQLMKSEPKKKNESQMYFSLMILFIVFFLWTIHICMEMIRICLLDSCVCVFRIMYFFGIKTMHLWINELKNKTKTIIIYISLSRFFFLFLGEWFTFFHILIIIVYGALLPINILWSFMYGSSSSHVCRYVFPTKTI